MRLLELIDETGSISAAGRAMAMSYRRAWLLVESLNSAFQEPVVAARPGGRRGGGASLTPFGRELVARYRTIERAAAGAVGSDLAAIEGALKPTDNPGSGLISDESSEIGLTELSHLLWPWRHQQSLHGMEQG